MKTIIRSIILFFIILAALLTFLLTPMGLKTSVALTSYFLPGKLTYQKISGVLIGPITVDDLRYDDAHQTILIHQLQMNWLPTALLHQQFHISTLQINGLHIINKREAFQFSMNHVKKIIDTVKTALSFSHAQINQAIIKNFDIESVADKQSFHFDALYFHSLPTKTTWNTDFFATLNKPQLLTVAMQLHGSQNHYALKFSVQGKQTNWLLLGVGDNNTLSFTTPNTQFLNGVLDANLQTTSEQGWKWTGKIEAKNLNFSNLNPAWERSMNFKMTGSAQQKNTQAYPTFDVQMSSHLNQHKQKIAITLSGTTEKQSLQAHIRLHHSAIDLHAAGFFNQQNQWVGTVDQLNIGIKHATAWRLQKTVALSASMHAFSASPLCLQSSDLGLFCVDAKWANQKIDLKAEMDVTHFKWLQAWTHFVKIPQGKLTANLSIAGDVANPNFFGTLNLTNGNLFFPQLNVTLNNVHASVSGNHQLLNFSAQALSSHQPITAKGSMRFNQNDFQAQGTIIANNALILNSNEFTITATPRLNIAIQNKNLTITGNILIPKAIVHSNDYHALHTLPAGDIVYIGNVLPPPKPFWNVSTNVLVTLGNAVRIENLSGFSASLGGSVRLLQTNNSEMLGLGRVFAHTGLYYIYGQALTLSPNSYVEYTNSPLDNPALNLKASKEIQSLRSGSNFMQNNLMVGIELQGTVHSPKITFFSNRSSLSQADILSYILLGYDTSSSPVPGNADILLRALSAVKLTSQGLLGKQNLATQIQSGLGLSELGVESETTVDTQGNTLDRQSAFVVGKNFTRRLYARYSIGILNPVNVFELRYLIDRQWAVQADSSTLGNGADVLYTISK